MFPVKSHYPDKSVYASGVQTEILKSERANPTAKIYHDTLIETVNVLREETGVFEVLLSDRNGCLTEGSRSNLFFVKGDCVYSAPEDDILHGITREKLKKVLRDESIDCISAP
ncbi:Aminotransferase class IV like protein, partial [Aduncisulcus paluster]